MYGDMYTITFTANVLNQTSTKAHLGCIVLGLYCATNGGQNGGQKKKFAECLGMVPEIKW